MFSLLHKSLPSKETELLPTIKKVWDSVSCNIVAFNI